jgi:hypothetical protein
MLSASGKISLESGKHRLRVGYFESLGGQGLKVQLSGPGFDTRPIPAQALSHEPADAP